MTAVSGATVADLGYSVGFRGDALVTWLAVTKGESRWDPAAVGDVSLAGRPTDDGRTWGPSIGLPQVRSIVEERGSGRARDEAALRASAVHQARAAYEISSGGTNWRPWSVFKSGDYREHLTEARALAAAREAAGPGSASGGGALTTTDTGATADETPTADVIVATGELPLAYKRPRRLADITVDGSGGSMRLAEYALDGRVELTTDEVSESTLTLVNPAMRLYGSGRGELTKFARVRWGDLDFAVAALELDGETTERVAVTLRDHHAQRLRRTNRNPVNGVAWDLGPSGIPTEGKNLSPTEYAQLQARGVGLQFQGQGSARLTDIAPVKDEKTGIYESPWEVIARLAEEIGFLAFVSAGVLYFGKPTWLAYVGQTVKVGWRRGWGDPLLDSLTVPKARWTADSYDGQTLDVVLPRWRGEQVHPGMVLLTRGIYGVPDRWLVRRVSWDVTGGASPVTVEAVEPVDPPVEASTPPEPTPSNTTPGAGGTPSTGTGSALDFVSFALRQVGDTYRFGAEAGLDDPDPDEFDCSELVQWALAQVGVTFVDGSSAQIAACRQVTVAEAGQVRGALLWHSGHIAISLGDGKTTVEAMGRRYGVREGNIGSRFTKGGIVPGLNYGVSLQRVGQAA